MRSMRTAARVLPYLILALVMFPAGAFGSTSAAGHLRVAIDSASHTADFSPTAARGGVVILHEWERSKMLSLKAANPALKVLMYKNLSFMQTRDAGGNASTGITTQDAASHPSWFLLNTSGARISPGNYGYLYAGDIGDRGYQEQWAADVLKRLDGWDGVFVDDTNPTMRHHYDVTKVAKYPSDAAYSAATGSALSVIGPKLMAAGKRVIPNFGSWSGYRSTVDPWLAYVSGGMEEQFGKWGTTSDVGYVTGNGWERQLGALKATQAAGKTFLAITHSVPTDAAAARYGWATMLLGGYGRANFQLSADYTNSPTYFPEYGYDIGDGTAAEVKETSGVHRRTFQRGLVLVNPTTVSVAVTFGGTYSGSGLTKATRATMAPHTALVLTRNTTTLTPQFAPAAGSGTAAVAIAPTATKVAVQTAAPTGTQTGAQPATSSRTARSLMVKVRCHSRSRACHGRVVVRVRGARKAAVGSRSVHVRARGARAVRVALNVRGSRALAASPKSLRVVLSRVVSA
jgi:hypothetical protein